MRLLPDKLSESAMRAPDACCLTHKGVELTFGQLASSSAGVAAWLRDVGVAKGDRVALLAEASPNYVIAYYGVLAAGCVAVALNSAARADDILGWLNHSASSALILDARHREAIDVASRLEDWPNVLAWGNGAGVLPADSFEEVIASSAEAGRIATIRDRDIAALIYTSGTTGRPKAVVLDHGNLASNTDSIVGYLELCARDSIACVLPFYYSFGNSVLHTHVAAGARIVVEENMVYPHKVVETIVRERVTGFAGVPSTYALLAARVDFESYDLSCMRYLAQAGGPMSPALTRRIRSMVPNAKIYVMYGLTEATARVTYLPPDRLDEKLGSIGIPIPGVDVEIRNEDGRRASAGEAGDLWVKGRNVMTGYWKDPESSRRVLVGGWLKTGDVATADKDGYLFIQGRRSDIIKVGAHRVYPKDVEAVIEEMPGVREVAVVGHDDEILGQTISAYVVSAPGATLTEREIKAHCRAKLAAYKIPKSIEFRDVLPRTNSGKVQRHLLDSTKTGTSQS